MSFKEARVFGIAIINKFCTRFKHSYLFNKTKNKGKAYK